jgi:hypothetical protein
VNKKVKALAVAAGAKTEADFALFANLVSIRDQFRKLKVPKGAPPIDGIVLRYDHCLTRGRFYQAQPLPKGYRRGRPKQCYGNSANLALMEDNLTYCEGFVLMPLGDRATHIEHGWCVTAEGKVIDVTLKEAGLSYFGVPYLLEEIEVIEELPVVDAIIEKMLEQREPQATPPRGRRRR